MRRLVTALVRLLALCALVPPFAAIAQDAAPGESGGVQPATITSDDKALVDELSRVPFPSNVPDDRNAALVYLKIFDLMSALPGVQRGRWDQGDTIPFAPASKRDGASGWDAIYSLGGMQSRFPVDWSQGTSTSLPHLSRARNLARLMVSQADFDYASGNADFALRDYGVVFTLAGHLRDEPTLIATLVSMAVENIARTALVKAAESRPQDVAFLLSASQMLSSRPSHLDMMPRVLRDEGRLAAYALLKLAADPSMTARGFAETLHGAYSGGSETDASGDALGMIENAAGLAAGSLTDDNWRAFVRGMAVEHWRNTQSLAAEIDAHPEGARGILELAAAENGPYLTGPGALLARLTLPAMLRVFDQAQKSAAENASAADRLLALVRAGVADDAMTDLLSAASDAPPAAQTAAAAPASFAPQAAAAGTTPVPEPPVGPASPVSRAVSVALAALAVIAAAYVFLRLRTAPREKS